MIFRMDVNKGGGTSSDNGCTKRSLKNVLNFNQNPSSRNYCKHLLHVFLCLLAIYKNNLKPPSGSGMG